MEPRHQLLAFILLTHTLTTLTWLIGGAVMGLSRRAARHWMLSSLTNGLALVLLVVDQFGGDTWRVLVSATLATWGAMGLRRGLQAFLRLPTRDLLQWAVLVSLTIWTLGICLPFGWVKAGALTAVVVSILILSLSARQTFPALYTEFDKTTAWVCAAVHMLAATMFVAIAVVSLGWVPGAEGAPYTIETLKFWVVFLSVSLSVVGCFVLGYVVIMRLVRRLEYLSEHDALTGLLNRRAIEALMDKEAQRLHRFGDPFALLLIDVDHFKRINDRLGHAAGDMVLSAVAAVLQSQAREVDHVARFGGEEFCVLLPRTDVEGALQAAERFREAVLHTVVPWAEENISVTVSVGLASTHDPGEALHGILRRADEALYRAKGEGRNRVVAAQIRRAA
ncbi:diguanylate cyclase [Aquabacterium fontiphilum]|jgi:diguanylate cyclase (GGDEF)-like protein|uniref:GGDEF domain-containing protein n=1 Tax=Aquabacterium fontiphilum TaxID=450365 RepID=UPI001378468E|nr:GGDEF domain-containing protein [Aquabacterium fontiphilum]NBD19840.1 diguanylate cyclase [Aquabacterium fontiphilum]